jgi:hypothetical protein
LENSKNQKYLVKDAQKVGRPPRRVDLGAPTRRSSEALDRLPPKEIHRTVLQWSPPQEPVDLPGLGNDVPVPQARA